MLNFPSIRFELSCSLLSSLSNELLLLLRAGGGGLGDSTVQLLLEVMVNRNKLDA